MSELLVYKICLLILVLKQFTVGMEFNFIYLWKYGNEYWKWWCSRPSFEDYLKHKV